MDQPSAKISSKLRGAALGATLAMLPMAIILLLGVLKIIKDPSEDIGKVLVVLQFIGCLIWAGCLTGSLSGAKQLNISNSGLALCIPGILLGGILQLVFVFDNSLFYKFMRFSSGETEALVLILLLTVVTNLPLAIGSLMAGKSLDSLRRSSIGYFALSVFPLISLLLFKILTKKTYGYYGYSTSGIETVIIILVILLVLLALTCISGWWGSASDATEIENSCDDDNDYHIVQPTYVEQPAAPAQTYNAVQPVAPQQPAQPLRPKSVITDEQRKLLMGMTNQELTNVINNPSLYANPAFVDEARKTLTKRQGWEVIKDYSDEQLLSVVHDNVQGFSPEVLDAASMELLSRENATFINEVSSLSIAELQGIIANADSYYDGYIQLATRILNERINNGANPA